MKLIDTHLHIWNLDKVAYPWLTPDLGILYQNYEIDQMLPLMQEAQVSHAILVQAANSLEETDFMLLSARQKDFVVGVVGWLPLLEPAQTALFLEKYKQNPLFKGVRHLIHDEPNPYWLLQESVLESLKILADNQIPFDVVGILSEHLDCVKRIGEKLPHLRIVLDHLNHPRGTLTNEVMQDWEKWLRIVAQHPNVFAKISGLGTVVRRKGKNLSEEDIKPAVDLALETFGVERCLCGGDYPVSLLAEGYGRTWQMYQNVLNQLLSLPERERVYWENANKFYNLAV
ncbi:amidohydrolase family protein [Thermoflexibacter ruber]|uniref:L-fuconolactonase n=1 Tax=Thermoflexibacter ruber TaxID=1003 RepID=A0A1I2B9F7_9BACT|nr:amidohydrolase family protein [Thermoflexibacter ruber]SFE52726.1 L-fuconolactonase [Thermoflexibacter ruber]